MPEHNSASAKKKAPSATLAAGGARSGGARASGGLKLGRKAARAAVKSDEEVDRLLDGLRTRSLTAYLTLGRVERVVGGSRFEVRLLDGEKAVLGLGGNIRGGRAGCLITLHDYVVVDGGHVKGRLSPAEAQMARSAVETTGIRVKKGFFAAATEDGELLGDDDLFDRSGEAVREMTEKSARKAALAAEAARLAQTRVLLPGRRAAPAPLAAIAETKEEPVDSDTDEEDEEVAPASGATGEVVRKAPPSGMNRRERRAAAQKAAEDAEAAAEFARSKALAEAMRYQEETGDLGTGIWVDDEEINVDAI